MSFLSSFNTRGTPDILCSSISHSTSYPLRNLAFSSMIMCLKNVNINIIMSRQWCRQFHIHVPEKMNAHVLRILVHFKTSKIIFWNFWKSNFCIFGQFIWPIINNLCKDIHEYKVWSQLDKISQRRSQTCMWIRWITNYNYWIVLFSNKTLCISYTNIKFSALTCL